MKDTKREKEVEIKEERLGREGEEDEGERRWRVQEGEEDWKVEKGKELIARKAVPGS